MSETDDMAMINHTRQRAPQSPLQCLVDTGVHVVGGAVNEY
jgi:hypothetical protein